MASDPADVDIEYIKEQLINESKQCEYPRTKIAVKFRYRNISYDIHRKWKEQSRLKTFLSFGSRRSSSVSNYGNTPIIMRRSISSNGDLAPYGIQSGGSLRGVPPEFEAEASMRMQFGSLRGLPTEKRLSNLDESDEIEGKDKNKTSSSRLKDGDSWDTASLNNAGSSTKIIKTKLDVKKDGTGFDIKGSNKNIDKLKQVEVNRSTESLMTVKKKKSWWFKRRKPEIAGESSKDPSEFSPAPMSDKASSDINLATHLPRDMSERQEEFHRSQIHLKGYSQKNVAGVNLSVRSIMTNPSVTSRASLTGSDIVNGSSKNTPHSEVSISPIKHNQSYEDQFEQSLGSGSASDCKSEEILMRSRHLSEENDASKRAAIHLNDLPSLSQGVTVLSPDSRPIRPLQFSSTTSISPPPSPILRQHYSKSSTTESYPHSLMDRPIITRMAKRRSSENSQSHSDAESTTVKKSNIAYTLTFQDEPICVNLRTKSQTLIPEADEYTSSKTKSDSNGSVDMSYDRQVSLPNERETSPGYRPYSSKIPSAAKSPVTGRKLLGSSKKNPKVVREKEKLLTDNEVINDHSAKLLSENLDLEEEENIYENNITSKETTSNGNGTSTIEVKLEKEIQIVHDIQTVCSVEDEVLTDQTNGQHSEEQNGESQPVCKLKRRNTFTLSSNGEAKSDKKDEEVTNGKSPETLQLVLDGSVEKNVTISVCHSPVQDVSHDNRKLENTELAKNTPTVSSRIPIKRGKPGGESLSRIPTLASPSAHSTPTSFIKPPNKVIPVAANLNSPVASHKSFSKSPERASLKKRSAIPSFRKPSLDESVVSQISCKSSQQDNFMRVDNNAIVVRRETILELKTEATSTLCVVM